MLDKYDGFLLNFDWPKKKLLLEIQYVSDKLGLANTDLSEWYTKDLIKSDKSFRNNYPLSNEIKSIYSRLKKRSENNHKVRINYTLEKKEMKKIIERLLTEIQEQGIYFKEISGKNY